MTRYRPPPSKRKGILVYCFWSVKAWQGRKREDRRIFLSCSNDKLDSVPLRRRASDFRLCQNVPLHKHKTMIAKNFHGSLRMSDRNDSPARVTCIWISGGSLFGQTHSTLIMSSDHWRGIINPHPSGDRTQHPCWLQALTASPDCLCLRILHI